MSYTEQDGQARERHLLQRLYDSEINFKISTFWDGGFDWYLGDEANGIHASGNADTFDEAVTDLCNAARGQFPHSEFAKGAILS